MTVMTIVRLAWRTCLAHGHTCILLLFVTLPSYHQLNKYTIIIHSTVFPDNDSTYAVSRPSFSINDGSTKRSTLNLVVSRGVLVAGEWVVLELSRHGTGQRL